MTPTEPYVSIIIPVFDDLDGLRITLESLKPTLKDSSTAEIIVCNDGGCAAISELTTRFGCREVRLDRNQGSYAARNAGVLAARGDVVVFLDADQRVSERWLTAGLELTESFRYVGGQVVVDLPEQPTIAQRYDAIFAFDINRSMNDGYFPTANLFVKRDVFAEVGLFDERLRSSGDVEFGNRVSRAGIEQSYAAEAITYHPPRSFRQHLRRANRVSCGLAFLRVRINGESAARLFATHATKLLLLPAEIAWRAIAPALFTSYRREPLALTLYGKILKAHWLLCFCRDLLRVTFNVYQPYQDPPITRSR